MLRPITFFQKLCRLWDNVEKCGGTRDTAMTIWRHFACWISKATCAQAHACAHAPTHTYACTRARTHAHTHTQICNTDVFAWQQWFRERASMLHYTYTGCLVYISVKSSGHISSWCKSAHAQCFTCVTVHICNPTSRALRLFSVLISSLLAWNVTTNWQ